MSTSFPLNACIPVFKKAMDRKRVKDIKEHLVKSQLLAEKSLIFENSIQFLSFKCNLVVQKYIITNMYKVFKERLKFCFLILQKVRYRMYDNITHYDSVIRTCTDQPCQQISTHEFDECIATPKQYMIGGCTLRSCCADRDYCNSAVASYCCTHFLMVLISVLLVTLF